jgi:uncharacterized membrane protein YphA (DoxX/SURF4 family)
MKQSTIILIFRVLIGAFFILSGITKLDSIYQFEQMIFKAGVTNWDIIPYLSRFTIAFEILLGICFFHHEGLKKFTIPATFLLLLVFTVHLSYTIITEGGFTGNCGCFGEKIPMTPFSSLIKNIITMAILIYLYKVPIIKPAREVFIPISLGLLSFVFVFFFFPVKKYITQTNEIITSEVSNLDTIKKDTITSIDSSTKVEDKQLILDNPKKNNQEKDSKVKSDNKLNNAITKEKPKEETPIVEVVKPNRVVSKYSAFKNFNDGISTNLDEGKKIVCMYNTGCDHCMENAKKLCELQQKGKLPEVYILFWGSESEIPAFFNFAKCRFPYKLLEPQVFFPLLGKGNFPRVSYLHEGNIIGEWEGDDFTSEKLEEALKK